MSAEGPSPRVNSTILPSFVGRSVTIVGKRIGGQGSRLNLEAPDGGNVVIDRSMSSRPWHSDYVEVTGVVNSDRSIRESRSCDFGNDFGKSTDHIHIHLVLHKSLHTKYFSDLKMYNELVLLANGPLKGLFV